MLRRSKTQQRSQDLRRRVDLYRDLLRREAQIGGSVFGPVTAGRRREFLCLDERTWLWHEEWVEDGRPHAVTTRYDIGTDGIAKSQNGRSQNVSPEEALNLLQAARNYQQRLRETLYSHNRPA